jgi:hypothetical protein
MGAAKEAGAAGRLKTASDVIKETHFERRSVLERIDEGTARETLRELRIDPDSTVGRAARKQLNPPYGGVDRWEATRLGEGQMVAVVNGKTLVPFDGSLTKDANRFFDELQMHGKRRVHADGTVSAPRLPAKVEIYEVSAPGGIDAAQATAAANTQFGAGGGTRLFVPDATDALANDQLFTHVRAHRFDQSSLRSAYEDPDFRAVDPAYQGIDPHSPVHALDPAHEKWMGRREGFEEKGRETVRDTAVSTGVAAGVRATDGSAK